MQIQGIALTDPGLKRKVNEDSYGYFPETGLFIVADGMGGHVAGLTASRLAVDKIKEFFDKSLGNGNPLSMENLSLDPLSRKLKQAIEYASQTIYNAGKQDIRLRGMGSTIVSLLVAKDTAYIAHVGDSRLYFLRKQKLLQLTQDHSLVNKLLQSGEITPEQARHHPQRNIITRALGTSIVKVDTQKQPLENGDTLLLCSDGLYSLVSEEELQTAMLAPAGDFGNTGQNLIAVANQRGGQDNITLILLRIFFP